MEQSNFPQQQQQNAEYERRLLFSQCHQAFWLGLELLMVLVPAVLAARASTARGARLASGPIWQRAAQMLAEASPRFISLVVSRLAVWLLPSLAINHSLMVYLVIGFISRALSVMLFFIINTFHLPVVVPMPMALLLMIAELLLLASISKAIQRKLVSSCPLGGSMCSSATTYCIQRVFGPHSVQCTHTVLSGQQQQVLCPPHAVTVLQHVQWYDTAMDVSLMLLLLLELFRVWRV